MYSYISVAKLLGVTIKGGGHIVGSRPPVVPHRQQRWCNASIRNSYFVFIINSSGWFSAHLGFVHLKVKAEAFELLDSSWSQV